LGNTLCLKKGYHPTTPVPEMTYNVFSGTLNPTHLLTHPTTNDNFNNSCPIPAIFGTSITG